MNSREISISPSCLVNPVPEGELLRCLRLRIPSDSHRHVEALEIIGSLETKNGWEFTVHWATISENETKSKIEIPKQVELVWENGTGQSIGWFPLNAGDLPDTPADPSASLGSVSREKIVDDCPKGLFIEELPRRKTIYMKWFDRDTPFTLVSGILFTTGSLAMGWYSGHRAMEIGSMAFSLVGVLIFYFGICKLFNKTCIVIENSQLNVTFRPSSVAQPVSAPPCRQRPWRFDQKTQTPTQREHRDHDQDQNQLLLCGRNFHTDQGATEGRVPFLLGDRPVHQEQTRTVP